MRLTTLLMTIAAALFISCSPQPVLTSEEYPDIFPDYTEVTVPAGIAPLDFCMTDERTSAIYVTVTGENGLTISSRGRFSTRFPLRRWHRLLSRSKGNSITVTVSAKSDSGWIQYRPFPVHISMDPIDYGICYRRIAPGYEAFGPMGIYERSLSSFRERTLIDNSQFDGCVNCHSFNRCISDDFSLHIRGEHGATLIRKENELHAYDTKVERAIGSCVYPYWHPSGRYIAYSSNSTRQGFHVCPSKLVEVFDNDSDVQIYDTGTGRLILPVATADKNAWETFPAFSPDGTTLWFTSAAPKAIPDSLSQIRYKLCRVNFNLDPDGGICQTADSCAVETVIDAPSQGKSIAFPKPSFDGRFLMYTLSDYGTFPIWHHEADLWLLDLQTGENRPLTDVNSDDTESYHDWDSSSRWFVFSSRRIDGRFTRLYICHINEAGETGKPFLLPQRNPGKYYSNLFDSYNVPEFVTSPVPFDTRNALKLINSKEREHFTSETSHP